MFRVVEIPTKVKTEWVTIGEFDSRVLVVVALLPGGRALLSEVAPVRVLWLPHGAAGGTAGASLLASW